MNARHHPFTSSPAHSFILPFAIFASVAAVFLAPALFGDRALLPTGLLMQMSPWAEEVTAPQAGDNPGDSRSSGDQRASPNQPRLAWNPILWDAVAQFYPWRAFVARWMRQGTIPLWDPHQFCGTPFLANSQSAVLYPLHLLLLDLPSGLPVARAMALLAAVHMTLAGFLTYIWLRALRLSLFAGALGGVTFMLSGFVVTWLELPSFLTVACWLPLLFLTIHRLVALPIERPSTFGAAVGAVAPRAAAVAAAVGLTLLGGHLQIAFYCLLASGLYAIWVFGPGRSMSEDRTANTEPQTPSILLALFALLFALTLGAMLAAPQLLPAMELSRLSHRVAAASLAGYEAYIRGAMPPGHLIRLFLPDFYGNPARGDYIAGSPADYTEFGGYFGGVSLLLVLVALLAWRRRPRETLFAAGLALLSLLLALGTPLNRLLYFGVPGFSQSGSPARVLVLFCFAGAWLAGLGAQALFEPEDGRRETGGEGRNSGTTASRRCPPPSVSRLSAVALAAWVVLLGATLLLARSYVESRGGEFGPLLAQSSLSLQRAVVFAVAAALLPVGLRRLSRAGSISPLLSELLGRGALAAVLVGELWLFGAGFNPTGPIAQVYPATPLIDALRSGPASGSGRVLAVNRRWSLFQHPHALLPPNSALALGLSDAQGYDSLFIGRYKGFANRVQGADTAPPENGNMLLLSNLDSPLLPLLAADRIVLQESQGGDGVRRAHPGSGTVPASAPTPGPSPEIRGGECAAPDSPPLISGEGPGVGADAGRAPRHTSGALALGDGSKGVRRTPTALPSPVSQGTASKAPVPAAGRETYAPPWPLLYDRAGLRVYRYAAALPRAFVAPVWRPVPEDTVPEELLRLAQAHGLGTTALISEPIPAGAMAGRSERVVVAERGPNEMTVSMGSASGPGMLVLLDNNYPGWRAADGGASTHAARGSRRSGGHARPLPLYRADLTFRGVPISGDTRAVRFRFEPASFRLGLYLAMLAIGVLLVMGQGCRINTELTMPLRGTWDE